MSSVNRSNPPTTFRLPPDDPDLMITAEEVAKIRHCSLRQIFNYSNHADPDRRLRSYFGGHGSRRFFRASDVRKWILSNEYSPRRKSRKASAVRA